MMVLVKIVLGFPFRGFFYSILYFVISNARIIPDALDQERER